MQFSIIIPVYNGEKYIKRCLDSLKNQTYKNIEIIVIDDGSTDNTKKIIAKVAIDDSRIKYYYKENNGVSAARNFGIEKASGDYITFVDADDYISEDYCEYAHKTLVDNNLDVIVMNYYYTYDNKRTIGIKEFDSNSFVSSLFSSDGIMGYVFNKFYKKNIIKSVRFDESIKIYEDLLFNVYLSNSVKRFTIVEAPLYYYIQNPNSVMHTKFSKDKTRFEAYKKIISFMIEKKYTNNMIVDIMYKYLWDFYRTTALYNVKFNYEQTKTCFNYFKYIKQYSSFLKVIKLRFMMRVPKIYFKLSGGVK